VSDSQARAISKWQTPVTTRARSCSHSLRAQPPIAVRARVPAKGARALARTGRVTPHGAVDASEWQSALTPVEPRVVPACEIAKKNKKTKTMRMQVSALSRTLSDYHVGI
jgi:hypothetical protein